MAGRAKISAPPQLLRSVVICLEVCGAAGLCLQGAPPELHPCCCIHQLLCLSGLGVVSHFLRPAQSNHHCPRSQDVGTKFSSDNTFFCNNGNTLVCLAVIKMLFCMHQSSNNLPCLPRVMILSYTFFGYVCLQGIDFIPF